MLSWSYDALTICLLFTDIESYVFSICRYFRPNSLALVGANTKVVHSNHTKIYSKEDRTKTKLAATVRQQAIDVVILWKQLGNIVRQHE